MAASRVQKWAVILAAYNFQIKHIKGVDNVAADSLSRIITINYKEINNKNMKD